MSLPNESVGSGGIAFTTPTCVKAWIEYPLNEQGDSTTKVYHHIMQVKRANYAPLAYDDEMTAADKKPVRSPFPDDANAFWVGDSEPSQIGGNLVEFERIFANIPADRTDPNGLYPFQFPGNSTSVTETIGVSTGNYSVAVSYANPQMHADITFDMATADAAKLSVGERVDLTNTTDVYEVDYGSGQFDAGTIVTYVTDVTGDTVTVRYSHYATNSSVGFTGNPNATFTTHTVKRPSLDARDLLQDSAASIVLVTYEKASSPSQLSAFALKFVVRNAAGVVTDNLVFSTEPTSATYSAYINDGQYIAAENESFTRWRGNIYERTAIQVLAK